MECFLACPYIDKIILKPVTALKTLAFQRAGQHTSLEHYCSIIQNLFFEADRFRVFDHTSTSCCHSNFKGVYIKKCRWFAFLFGQTKALLHLETLISSFLGIR